MENQSPSIKSIAYTYGLYLALVSVAGLIIMYVLSLQKSWTISIISIVLSILILVYGIKAYKHANGGLLSVGKAIKVGLAIAVVGGLLSAIYSYVHYSFIYPEFIEMTKEAAYEQMMTQNPNLTDEQANQAMEMQGMFMNPGFFSLMSILSSLFFGLIISLIAGLIMRKDE
ncbi:MAG: DUF4199 domain-containing protein [Bacteroidia bacterium]|nr:DUF4199 domain-containing protein [Bacteroidia bacterium]